MNGVANVQNKIERESTAEFEENFTSAEVAGFAVSHVHLSGKKPPSAVKRIPFGGAENKRHKMATLSS